MRRFSLFCVAVSLLAVPLTAPAAATEGAISASVTLAQEQVQLVALNPLERPVTLESTAMRLGEVLAEISAQADLGLVYSNDVVPVDRRVTVKFRATPAAEALRSLLANTGVDFQLTASQQVTLIKRPERSSPTRRGARVQDGRITGRLVDAATGEPLAAADVWLDGTRHRTVTNAEGRFLLNNVPAGTYNLRVRRIGYAAMNRVVTVTADQTLTVDFELDAAPTQLDEVVATVTGEQRLRELGHVVGRINADSLVREAPISTVSELLMARVPGLQVFQNSGTVGGDVALRIRAPSSIYLSNEPIVIVDGIRYNSGRPLSNAENGPFNVEPTSRLNDINPNDIATIEVVKGPSASTLYGTDAANGVIVITTKSGQQGPPRWRAYMRAGVTEIPSFRHPDTYWGWGTATSSCTLRNQWRGTCQQDSVTVIPNPLNDPELTIFGVKPRWQYGASVSGGSPDVRYYFSADFEEATGPLRLPAAMAAELREQLGRVKPDDWHLEPNRQEKMNLRASVDTRLSEKLNVRVNLGYTHNATRQISVDNSYNKGTAGALPESSLFDSYGHINDGPLRQFARRSTEDVARFSVSGNVDWRLASWLQTRALIGLDRPDSHRESLYPHNEWLGTTGSVGDDRTRQYIITGELGASASFQIQQITARTSLGVQYVRNYRNHARAHGTNLRPGGSSISSAASVSTGHFYHETATLGSYLEQLVGLNDRLFLTLALRADGATSFGNDYKAAIYPKTSLSWVASEEPFMPRIPGLDELRLRYALGASGQHPTPMWVRAGFASSQAYVEDAMRHALHIFGIASVDLRPERVREHEVGLDAALLEGRFRFDLTWNWRRTKDSLTEIVLPAGIGGYRTNIGIVDGRGFEAQITARVIDNPLLSWDLLLTHSASTNTLVEWDKPDGYDINGGLVRGYPLGARFMRPLLGFEDRNGDGVLDDTEVIMGDTAVYVGQSTPGKMQVLTTTLGILQHRVRLSALFDRRSDFIQRNYLEWRRRTRLRGAVDPTAPLEEQAKVIARFLGGAPGQNSTAYDHLEPGGFTRLREVSLSLTLPDSWVNAVRLRQAMFTLSGRNLALWKDYSGPDPESMKPYSALHGSLIADGIPHGRSWIFRLDLGF